jgi:hypothetical protein
MSGQSLVERIESLACLGANGMDYQPELQAILADVRELESAARRTIVMVNTTIACYERNPGNFAMAMREMRDEQTALNAILTKCAKESTTRPLA